MLKIRLTRRGKKHSPSYRIVVANAQTPRDGKFIADLGYYNPIVKPIDLKINTEEYKKWIKNGAQPTEKVKTLFNLFLNPNKEKKLEASAKKLQAKRKIKKEKSKAESQSNSA